LKTIPHWAVWILAVFLTIVSSVIRQPVYAFGDEVYHYREVSDNDTKTMQWRLQKDDGYMLTFSSGGEKYVTITDQNYNTRRWQVVTEDGQTKLTAERIGEVITVYGRFKAKPVNKRFEIDGCPWYQATSLSLRGLVASADEKRLFWTIRLKTMTVHKLKAVKKGVEQVEGNDNLLRIRLTLTGLLAPFWKSDYWFALPEGVLFRFQCPSGPPGSPIITVTRAAG
jgi:hypothetical protein